MIRIRIHLIFTADLKYSDEVAFSGLNKDKNCTQKSQAMWKCCCPKFLLKLIFHITWPGLRRKALQVVIAALARNALRYFEWILAGFNQSWISKTTHDFCVLGLWRSLSKYSLRGEITVTDAKKPCPPPKKASPVFPWESALSLTWPADRRNDLGGIDPFLHLFQADKTASSSCFLVDTLLEATKGKRRGQAWQNKLFHNLFLYHPWVLSSKYIKNMSLCLILNPFSHF